MAQTILVTGAGRGIGLATAEVFLEHGWHVIGTYHTTPIPLQSPNLTTLRLDLTSAASIAAIAREASQAAPHLDALINNAGVLIDPQDTSIDIGKVQTTFEIDVLAQMKLTEQLLPYMSWGSQIVNIDSSYGALSEPQDNLGSAGYRIAKAALNMYTRVLAFHLEPRGIIVSSLDPGWTKTDMGMSVASGGEHPDREPQQAARAIYDLITTNSRSGYFWHDGRPRDW